MSGKLSIVALACLALALPGAMAASAYADDSSDTPAADDPDYTVPTDDSTVPSAATSNEPNYACLKNALDAGVYDPNDPSSGPGSFGLKFSPAEPSQVSEMTGSVTLCGSDETKGTYYRTVTLTYPGEAEKVRCAVKSPSAGLCTDAALPDNAFAGDAKLEVTCRNVTFCPAITRLGPIATSTYVRYKARGPYKLFPNACRPDPKLGKAVACFETVSAEVLRSPISTGLTCAADIVVRRVDSAQPPNMTLYQPACATNKLISGKHVPAMPIYYLNIDPLHFCARANPAKGAKLASKCGSKTSMWVGTTGRETDYDFALDAEMTDGTHQIADAYGSWTAVGRSQSRLSAQ